MKILILLFGLLISSSFVFGQNWQKQYGVPQTSYNVNSVKAFDANTVYYVNTNGDFSKSMDGGITWTASRIVDGSITFGMCFFDKLNGWVSDYRGGIYRTADAGDTWISQSSGTNNFIRKFHFVSSAAGWAVGSGETNGILLKTTNGGTNWQEQNLPFNNSLAFHAVHFVNSLTGWVLGYRGNDYFLYNTTNGGTNWTLLPDPNTLRDVGFFNLMQFLDGQKGFMVDQFGGFIYKTTNGGRSFTKLPNPAAIGTVQNFGFVNEFIGYTTDDQGNIFKTIDGGLSWNLQNSGVPSGTLNGLSVIDAEHAFVAGIYDQLKTSDGGDHWVKIGDEYIVFKSIQALSSTLGFVVGNTGKILKTTDGSTWIKQLVNTVNNLNSVKFISANEGIVVGNNGTILKTTNGGVANGTSSGWNLITVGGVSKNLNSVDFIDSNQGFVVGDAQSTVAGMGTLLQTMDGGNSWTSVTGVISQHLKDIQLLSTNLGWVVGSKGTILKFDGSIWSKVTIGTSTDLNAVYFVSSLVGYAVGASNKILKSIDGGFTWTEQVSPLGSTIQFNDVFFTDENNGWVVGNSTFSTSSSSYAALLRTTDGGLTWKRVSAGVLSHLNSINFVPSGHGLIAANGSILKFHSTPYLEFVNIPTAPTLNFNYRDPMPAFQVNVLNADGSINSGYNAEITIQQAGGGALLSGSTTQLAVQGVATFSGLRFNRPANLLLFKAVAGSISGYSPVFATTATGASKLVFARLNTTVMTNATIPSFVVVAQDSDGYNSMAAYGSKPITLSGISGMGSISGTLVKNTSAGSVTFNNISFNKRGTYTLSASDGQLSVISFPIVVGATQLSISGISSALKQENVTIPPVFVSAVDSQGKLDISFNSNVSIQLVGENGVVSGNVSTAAVNGIATFNGLSFERKGTYTLVASSLDLSTAVSAPIHVEVKATKILLSIVGGTTVGINSPLSTTFMISAVNGYDELDTNYNGFFNLIQTTGIGSVSGIGSVNAVRGVATLSGLSFGAQGLYVLSITGASLSGTSFAVLVSSNSSIVGIFNSNNESNNLQVYPNPFSSSVIFTFPYSLQGNYQFNIIDQSGTVIEKTTIGFETLGAKEFLYTPPTSFQNGTYFYLISGKNGSFSGKLILLRK